MRRARIQWALVLGLILAGAGCDRSPDPADDAATGTDTGSAPVNLLLITMDTTRADHIGCYGRKQAATPTLDGLARTGTQFSAAFSQVPITLPSHTVLLTGTYPPENGVRVNGRHVLGTDLPTLPEIYRQRGYRTGAFVAAAVLHARHGLNRGFDVYEDEMVQTQNSPLRSQISGDLVCDRALTWLDTVKDKPFMGWVHFFDPHTPYSPPESYKQQTRTAYDGEIAFMDANIARLTGWLQLNGLSGRTLVVAVADHGESLGEHGFEWHSLLVYDSIMRVPLFFSLPGLVPGNKVCPDPVGVVDIAPTILDLMDWPVPDQMSGRSLEPLLRGQTLDSRGVYGETDYPYSSYGWANLRCLIEGPWKYIRAPEPELYNLESDRGELNNLAASRPDIADALEQALTEFESRMRRRESEEATLDAEALSALRSLGYVGGATPAVTDTTKLKNPRDMVDVAYQYRLAEVWLATDRVPEAIDVLEKAVARSPESFVLVHMLGKAYAEAGRLEESQQQLMSAIAMYPQSADAHADFAVTLGARGRYRSSADACRKALELQPRHKKATKVLQGAEHFAAKQVEEIRQLREQLDANPAAVRPALRLAYLLGVTGEQAERFAVLRRAIKQNPGHPQVSAALAWVLATAWDRDARNGDEALRLARDAVRAAGPTNTQVSVALAAALAETGDFQGAATTVQGAIDQAVEAGDQASATVMRTHLADYQRGRPHRELP